MGDHQYVKDLIGEEDYLLALQLQQNELDRLEIKSKKSPIRPPIQKVSILYSHFDIAYDDDSYNDFDDSIYEEKNSKYEKISSKYEKIEQFVNKSHSYLDSIDHSTKPSKDTSDYQTKDGMDTGTRMMLYKMRNKGIFKQINGCFAQGKEATLFHGTPGESTLFDNLEKSEYAIKIYKTTKIEFKDREKYVQGEWRFRFNKINKKTVAIPLWTEKEFRNLKRLKNNNILCPDPILLKKHILVMSFIGSNGRKAPQLGEITVNKEKWTNYYWECIQIMRNMYQLSGLVHGDLSSYNILVHEDKLWIIDLSQAVMYDHPRSSDFLKRDCENITKFFYNKNVTELMTIKELYIFILNKTIDSNNINHLIQEIKYQIIDKQKEGEYDPNPAEDIAWMKTYTPRTLIDIVDPFNINKNIDYVLEAYSKQ